MVFRIVSLLLLSVLGLHAQVTASLESTVKSVQPGKPLVVALHLSHSPHWHTYWVNAGTGYPSALSWNLPDGWTASEFSWPTPKTITDNTGAITGNGFDGELYLPLTLTPPANLKAGETVTLGATATWLMCNDRCVPGKTALSLSLPVSAETPAAETGVVAALGAQNTPSAWTAGTVTAHRTATSIVVRVQGLKDAAKVRLFSTEDLAAYEQIQVYSRDGDTGVLTAPLSSGAEPDTKELKGVLTYEDGSGRLHGISIEAPFTPLPTHSAPAVKSEATLPVTLALAWFGGLILNLMPCVFPVLGIKVLGFVNQAGGSKQKVKLHGLVFTLGVLLSFWTLAGILTLLRAGGENLGWGFQLQSPLFVFGLAAVMLIFALSMSGVFEFGLRATGVGAGLQMKDGLSGSFFTGILATIVATPCSAPFLAPALGAALAVSTAQSFLIFSTIAIGLSTPYLMLSLFPAAVRVLPRPGAWMETFKQVMAFPLYGTAAYLAWVLAGQLQDSEFLSALIGLVIIAMAAWFYGRFHKPGHSGAGAWLSLGATAAIAIVGLWIGLPQPKSPDALVWQPWSAEAVAKARADGKTVYVDFTARWCATCQTNKKIVLHSKEVLSALKDKQVVLLRGDWTNQDPLITAELARYHRSAVPFNQIFKPGSESPVLLPELLTPSVVLQALQ